MNNELSRQIIRAEHAFRAGNPDLAEGLLKQVLDKHPSDSKANELLAYIVGNKGDLDASILLLKKATRAHNASAEAWYHLGTCLQNKGNSQEAIVALKKSLILGGDFFEGYYELGMALANSEKYQDAIAAFHKASILNPQSCEAFYNKAKALDEIKCHEEALSNYGKALAIRPDFASAWYNCGITLYDLKRYAAALESFDKAIALQPENTKALNRRGVTLHDLKRYDEALLYYEKALAIKPDDDEVLSNRGVTLHELKRYDEALLSYEKALTIKPENFEAWTNQGTTLQELKRDVEALTCYEKSLAIKPDYAEAHFNEGCLRLSNCDFVTGWNKYAWRLKTKEHVTHKFETRFPLWHGENNNESLLVWGEQGPGDQIMCGGMLNQLKQKTGQLTVTLDPRLIPLFQKYFTGIRFVSEKDLADTKGITKQISMSDIGKFCRTKLEDFPVTAEPYLKTDAQKKSDLRTKLREGSKLICGISWQSKNAKASEHKSLALKDLLPILSLNTLSFIDLQYGDTSAERENLKATSNIEIHHVDEIDNFNDLDGLAALIDACDIVVTTSNTTVHIAGALGKKTYLMVPYSRGKLWYWHEGHTQSLWYPAVKIFRQPADGDWEPVINQVAAELDLLRMGELWKR